MKYSPEVLRRKSREDLKKSEKILRGEERIIDLKPEKEKFDLPVLVSPGWGNITENFIENNLKVIAGEGRRVLSLDFPREKKIKADPDQPPEHLQKAMAILELIEDKGLEKVEAVGHSEGCLNLAIAALLAPEKFKNLVFVAPAGMIGKDSFWSLAHRFAIVEGGKSRVPFKEAMSATMKYLLANPAMAAREVKAMSESDIYEIFKELKKNGLGISVVSGVEDDVFSMENIQREYSERKGRGDFHGPEELLDGFYSVKSIHEEFIGHGGDVNYKILDPSGNKNPVNKTFKMEKQAFPKFVHKVLIALEEKKKNKDE